jgi:hypothetical protein
MDTAALRVYLIVRFAGALPPKGASWLISPMKSNSG